MNELDETVSIVKLGIEAERFLNSDLGKYLVERAEHEREAAVKEFKQCDVTDPKAVRKIQDAILFPDKFVAWLTEAIQVGYVKHEELRRAEHESLS